MQSKVVEYEYEYEYDESKEPSSARLQVGEGATVDESGVTTCSCGRSYTKRKNYIRYRVFCLPSIHFPLYMTLIFLIRHITFECGKEPRFECEFKDCTARFKRKDNLKGHMDRVHLSCT